MGNAAGKLSPCFCDSGALSGRHDIAVVLSTKPLDDDGGIGHSFCYIRPDQFGLMSSSFFSSSSSGTRLLHSTEPQPPTTFHTISGASISANTSTPLSTVLLDSATYPCFDRAASFESSPSFASVPLQPIPRDLTSSGPLTRNSGSSILGSGPIERGFLSGPIERGFLSGPMDPPRSSAALVLQRSPSHSHSHDDQVLLKYKRKLSKWVSMKGILNAISGIGNRVKGLEWGNEMSKSSGKLSSTPHSSQVSLDIDHTGCYYVAGNGNHHHIQEQEQEQEMSENLQWAQGKAGEDRVHVVVSEDYGWIFVGIYDGFNGPDAPDFLLSNLYSAVHKELLCLLGGTSVVVDESEAEAETALLEERINSSANSSTRYSDQMENAGWESTGDHVEKAEKKKTTQSGGGGGGGGGGGLNGLEQQHDDVLKALSEALRKTEEAYFEMAEKMALQNPELFMMGSCVLVTLMMGEDVYLMNVGDSRAVIGQLKDVRDHHHHHPIRIHENNNDSFDDWLWLSITPLQLTVDHNTHVKEEVQRIRKEHLDDPSAVANDCVKCSLKVTRAFGAGFLKQPKWNEGLLEMFRIEYVGSSPYITCWPSLRHHKLGPRDKFLILSSDGLYQYFTNQEAVSHVEMFMSTTPEGDPAQHLIEEVLFRAAKKAGIDFHELLDIPQGERRRYHDDVSIIVISLEGTIWRSSA